MSRGSKFDDHDRGPGLAGPKPSVVGPPSGHAVIPFPFRSARSSSVTVAGGDPPSSPAPFESLGTAAQAVVMKLANKQVRLSVWRIVPAREDGDGRDDP